MPKSRITIYTPAGPDGTEESTGIDVELDGYLLLGHQGEHPGDETYCFVGCSAAELVFYVTIALAQLHEMGLGDLVDELRDDVRARLATSVHSMDGGGPEDADEFFEAVRRAAGGGS